jgi:hypothetical protein
MTLILEQCYTSLEYLPSSTMMFSPKYEMFCHYILSEAIFRKDERVYEIIANSMIFDTVQKNLNTISSFKRDQTHI